MHTANVATPRRKSQRRHRRNSVFFPRERHPVRIVGPETIDRTPVVAWSDPDTRHSDLGLATWEDAEWG